MRVIVTRPAAQAAAWVEQFEAAGIDAVALPLIGIAPAADASAVVSAWQRLAAHQLAVFVSPNAVEEFFALRPDGVPWPQGTLAGSVGPGSTQALLRHGVPAHLVAEPAADSEQFDSEGLWRALASRDWRGRAVLVVRGDGGREWLADTLRSHGADVEFVAAYRRIAPALDAPLLDEAVARPSQHLWFFSSSEAIANLEAARPSQRWAGARAIATHPRIAERARDCGFGVVRESSPTLAAVVACIQSFES
jgi:uroporphyrinogen-III synthase